MVQLQQRQAYKQEEKKYRLKRQRDPAVNNCPFFCLHTFRAKSNFAFSRARLLQRGERRAVLMALAATEQSDEHWVRSRAKCYFSSRPRSVWVVLLMMNKFWMLPRVHPTPNCMCNRRRTQFSLFSAAALSAVNCWREPKINTFHVFANICCVAHSRRMKRCEGVRYVFWVYVVWVCMYTWRSLPFCHLMAHRSINGAIKFTFDSMTVSIHNPSTASSAAMKMELYFRHWIISSTHSISRVARKRFRSLVRHVGGYTHSQCRTAHADAGTYLKLWWWWRDVADVLFSGRLCVNGRSIALHCSTCCEY